MDRTLEWNAIARYLTGECSAAEEAEISAWAAADPSNRATLQSAAAAWEAAGMPGSSWAVESALARVKGGGAGGARVRPVVPSPDETAPIRARVSWTVWAHRWQVAAVLGGIVAAGSIGLARLAHVGAEAGHLVVQELVTEKGQRATLRLSDGTEVALGPGSRLELQREFGESAREVHLSGQAFFTVARDPSRPFLVHTRGAVTRVLGTEFDVRAYPDDAGVRIVVAEGEVSLRSAAQTGAAAVVLRGGELGELPAGSAKVLTRTVDPEQYLGWREGRLAFENAPLSRVAREIERWYGVPVRLSDAELGSRRLTASFRDQPVEKIVQIVAASLGLRCVRVGEMYVFTTREKSPVLADL
jgi:transmembrane sensor